MTIVSLKHLFKCSVFVINKCRKDTCKDKKNICKIYSNRALDKDLWHETVKTLQQGCSPDENDKKGTVGKAVALLHVLVYVLMSLPSCPPDMPSFHPPPFTISLCFVTSQAPDLTKSTHDDPSTTSHHHFTQSPNRPWIIFNKRAT